MKYEAMSILSFIIAVAIVIRLAAAWGSYWTVIRRMLAERKELPQQLKSYNMKLILSVVAFIVTCIGTSIFQACRVNWLPNCNTEELLDVIALFNSVGLLSAYISMHLLINATDKVRQVTEDKNIKEIKMDVKEVKKDVKIVKEKI